jgi:hypothetical protein
VVAECGRKIPLPGSAQRPDHRDPTQRGLASAVHFEVALALASAAPMTESGKIDNGTRREFTLIGYVTGHPQTSRSARSAFMGHDASSACRPCRWADTCALSADQAQSLSVIHRGGSFRPSGRRGCGGAAARAGNRGRGYRQCRCRGIARAAVPPFTAGRGSHHAPAPAKALRAAPPPQRQAPGLPAAPRRALPSGLQLHVHGLSAEDGAARIARRQQER